LVSAELSSLIENVAKSAKKNAKLTIKGIYKNVVCDDIVTKILNCVLISPENRVAN